MVVVLGVGVSKGEWGQCLATCTAVDAARPCLSRPGREVHLRLAERSDRPVSNARLDPKAPRNTVCFWLVFERPCRDETVVSAGDAGSVVDFGLLMPLRWSSNTKLCLQLPRH